MTDFIIDVGSDQEHEDLVAEIYYRNDKVAGFLAMITQEKGFENLEIEVYPRNDGKPWRFQYVEFCAALEKAKKRLWELRRSSSE